MNDQDGGSAFPIEGGPGMSLRDYFAAAALQGVCALPTAQNERPNTDARSRLAYEYADAMLKARSA